MKTLEIEPIEEEMLEEMVEDYKNYLRMDYRDATGEEPYIEWDFVKKIENLLHNNK